MKNIEFHNVDQVIAQIYHSYLNCGEISGTSIGFGDSENSPVCDQMVTIDGTPIAFISLSLEDDNDISIDGFEVIASKRGQGLGRSIINHLKEQVDCDRIRLIPEDQGAILFWGKCGFEKYDNGSNMYMEWEKEPK